MPPGVPTLPPAEAKARQEEGWLNRANPASATKELKLLSLAVELYNAYYSLAITLNVLSHTQLLNLLSILHTPSNK